MDHGISRDLSRSKKRDIQDSRFTCPVKILLILRTHMNGEAL
jgi:hypothetical protein